MTRLLVATRSSGKQRELARLLAEYGWVAVTPEEVGLQPSPEEDGLEVFDTFEGNARAKAQWFADRSGMPALADDSGLEVDALGGAPGVWSKRFAGNDGPDELVAEANNQALLERLADVPDEERTARYRCVLVLAFPAGDGRAAITAAGTTEGRKLKEAVGEGGFGYDPIFLSDDLGISFGVAARDQKGGVSHRGRAVRALFGGPR